MPSPKKARTEEYFPGIAKIPYKAGSHDPLTFKHYNAEEVVLGKKMKDWCRFAVCWWHTWTGQGMDMFGPGPIKRDWEADPSLSPMDIARRRVEANFEFMEKTGIEYFCFHDRDIAPEGKTIAETNKNLDEITDLIKQHMDRTGKKLLWGTANLFSNPRYMNGAATNPDPHVFAFAAQQVKKALELTKKLGGENYVLWGGREGYQTLLNTDLRSELDHLAAFMTMVRDYKNELGMQKVQLLLEPKPREPTSHQYDFDTGNVIAFLKTYGLDADYKVNLEANHGTLAGHSAEHEVALASAFGFLGSIDANHNEALLGWDTDMFPSDVKMATMIMRYVVKQGGLAPGGLNFDAKLRRESTDKEDLFIAHINGMDCYAQGLKVWAKMDADKSWDPLIKARYADWKGTDIGKQIEGKKVGFKELAAWIEKNGEPEQRSGKEEKFNGIFASYF